MSVVLEEPSPEREADFVSAVERSRSLFAGFVTPPASGEAYGDYLGRCARPRVEGRLVVLQESNEMVGVINLNEVVLGSFRSAYLGYYAFSPHAGRGYMREGLEAMISWAFGDLSLHRLEANIQPDNVASIGLVRGLGFRMEGFSPRYLKVGSDWRDHERWALLVDEWDGP
ncbi:MAG: GNAT family N-acetyltransferase [Myxococcota bacterium]|nr:GNAT family N-acetyltransferase [Myxococcota bacterium]